MKDTLKLGCTLAIYAAAACTVLALVNNVTAPRIASNKIEKANSSMKIVMAEADSFEPYANFQKPSNSSISITGFYAAKKEGKTIGAVAQVSGPTYDKGTVIVGMAKDGTVTGLQFLELSDSPGFGLKANDPNFKLPSGKTFYDQFAGLKASDGFALGSTVDAISGATITSQGVCNLVAAGAESMTQYFKENADE